MKKFRFPALLGVGLALATGASAESLVYKPLNPSMGGNPDYYPYLLGTADIQNQYRESGGGGGFPTIEFPDISIDLGGNTDDPPADDTTDTTN